MNLNRVFILGNVVAQPEARMTPSGQTVATFRVATNRVWKDQAGAKQEAAEFHSIVVWGRLAEIARQYLTKGQLVLVEGRIQTRSWQGQDGQKKYRTEIVGQNFQMGPKTSGGAWQGRQGASAPPNTAESKAPTTGKAQEDIPIIDEDTPVSFEEEEKNDDIKPEDIPF